MSIQQTLAPQTHDLGGLVVKRSLPSRHRRMAGPFIFWDHFGPADFAPGTGVDVRPHPHCCLATVTYLFEGSMVHRDSLGHHQEIRPRAVNWMTAGRGIVHSERTGPEARAAGHRLHGIQSWVALPLAGEERAPSFRHYGAAELPEVERDGVRLRVIAGEAFGLRSPVETLSPVLYVEVHLRPGAMLVVPPEYAERALYPVTGTIAAGDAVLRPESLCLLGPGSAVRLKAETEAHLMLLGGAPLDGERHVWWNFVASTKARIETAKRDWAEGRFPKVPGDEEEFIPLPRRGPRARGA